MQVSICARVTNPPVIGIGLALDGFGLVPRLSVRDRGKSPNNLMAEIAQWINVRNRGPTS